jgi:hypothetical protein
MVYASSRMLRALAWETLMIEVRLGFFYYSILSAK